MARLTIEREPLLLELGVETPAGKFVLKLSTKAARVLAVTLSAACNEKNWQGAAIQIPADALSIIK